LHQTRPNDHDHEKGNQGSTDVRFLASVGRFAGGNISTFGHVLVELVVAISNISWERLTGKQENEVKGNQMDKR
jgi:hypothetical protein